MFNSKPSMVLRAALTALALGVGIGAFRLDHGVLAAAEMKPEITGYVLSVEKGKFLVTGQARRGHETAVVFGFKDAQKKIAVGEKVQVWCSYMLESYPGQSTAEKIEVLGGNKHKQSPLTRAEAVRKALENLKPGRNLSITFIRKATYDEKAKVWKIEIGVGRKNDRRNKPKAWEIEVGDKGRVVGKTEKAIAEEKPPVREEPEQAAIAAEAVEAELAIIAKSQGWTRQQARSVIESQQAFGQVSYRIQQDFPKKYVGAISASKPGAVHQILIKGAVTPEIQKIIDDAPVKIKIVDQQPYSMGELRALADAVSEKLEGLGYLVLAGSTDFGPPCRIHYDIREKKGGPNTVDGVKKLLPAEMASIVTLTIRPVPTLIRQEGAGKK